MEMAHTDFDELLARMKKLEGHLQFPTAEPWSAFTGTYTRIRCLIFSSDNEGRICRVTRCPHWR